MVPGLHVAVGSQWFDYLMSNYFSIFIYLFIYLSSICQALFIGTCDNSENKRQNSLSSLHMHSIVCVDIYGRGEEST